VAGVIKMTMALRNELLPKTLHLDAPSRKVDWSLGESSLLTDAVPWPREGSPRRAGVSSFGISGTNVHMVIEEAPLEGRPPEHLHKVEPSQVNGRSHDEAHIPNLGPADGSVAKSAGALGAIVGGVVPWPISGRGENALRAQAEKLSMHVSGRPSLDICDVGFSLACSRSVFENRAVVIGSERADLLTGLEALHRGGAGAGLVYGEAHADAGPVAFLFTGQGAQRVGMGRELYRESSVFKEAFSEVCEGLDSLLGHSLEEVTFGEQGGGSPPHGDHAQPETRLDETMFTQAALFALEVALFRQVQAWGVRPAYLLGHSIGELAAAYVAEMMSLEDACKLVAARGRLMGALPEGGGMVAVEASEQEALKALEGFEESVALAAVNGPSSVVLSGDEEPVLKLADMWAERGRKTRRLRVSHAFHSHRMDGMLADLAQIAGEISFAKPRIPVVSNLTGEPLSDEQVRDPGYWANHVRRPVRFADGVRWLHSHGVDSFLELGPAGVLSSMCLDCLAGEADDAHSQASTRRARPGIAAEEPTSVPHTKATPTAVSLLRTGRSEARSALGGLAELWVRGVAVDWKAVFQDSGAERVGLPTYAFQRERYWLQFSAEGASETFSGAPPFVSAAGTEASQAMPQEPYVATHDSDRESCLLEVQWVPAAGGSLRRVALARHWPVLCTQAQTPMAGALEQTGIGVQVHASVDALIEAMDREGEVAQIVLLECAHAAIDGPGTSASIDGQLMRRAHEGGAQLLELMQRWLAEERLAGCRLVAVTQDAVGARAGDGMAGLAQAPLWGLVRSAQLEHPGRFAIIDVDGEQASWSMLSGAIEFAVESDEPQLALRNGMVLTPRLAPRSSTGATTALNDGVVIAAHESALITGGTGYLGALLARHLVSEHGVRHLILAGRKGSDAEGASELRAELTQLGANVTIAACDVSDRVQLAELIGAIPEHSPLRLVVHAAGVLDDGVIESLTRPQLERVLVAKSDAAWNLHELTEQLDLSAFVLFSSSAGVIGTPGQGNYAAANTFLDALAAYRAARGMPGVSIAWGVWEASEGMAGEMVTLDARRLARMGMRALTTHEGLSIFDATCSSGEPSVVALPLDIATLGIQAEAGLLPPILRGLVDLSSRAALGAQAQSLLRRLSGASSQAREEIVLEAVCEQVSAVLGDVSANRVDPEKSLLELGFDSLAAVELRSRLTGMTKLRIPTSVILDRPTPAALVAYIDAQLAFSPGDDGDEGSRIEKRDRPGLPMEHAHAGTLFPMLLEARDRGTAGEFMELLMTASKFRPTFDLASAHDVDLQLVRLADGPGDVELICLPTVVAISGPHQYVRFARGFHDSRPVSAVTVPGFLADERLPASREATVEALVAALERRRTDRPYVLVGYSSGGWLAHALACRLEGASTVPVGLVLIDTFPAVGGTSVELLQAALGETLDNGIYGSISDERLTAMGAYLRLFSDWRAAKIGTPTLLVRASEPMSSQAHGGEWKTTWDVSDLTVEAPGNHITMIEEGADTTAQAVRAWVGNVVVENQERDKEC
jgi:acyl transferase domain-containing protein